MFANNTADALEISRVLRGKCDGDCRSRELPPQENQRPKTLCVPHEMPEFFGDYGPAYRKAWEKALDSIRQLGLPIQEIDISMFQEAAKILYDGPYIAERWSALGSFVEEHPQEIFPVTRKILESGKGTRYSAAMLFATLAQLEEYKLETEKLLKDAVLIMPTTGGTFTREQVDVGPHFHQLKDGGFIPTTATCWIYAPLRCLPGLLQRISPFGITAFALSANEGMFSWLAPRYEKLWQDTIELAVCGLHMGASSGTPIDRGWW